nr:integrase, catalytic region, zinc finger, CCHC-type, peptidase aspartic, catalytic [Tanacetum cinerariifolium]
MFDEYFNPPPCVVSPIQVAATPRAMDLADSPVLTLIDQDAPSTSIPSTQEQEQSLIIFQGVKESPKTPYFHDDPLHETLNEDSTFQGSSSNVRPTHTLFELLGKWFKDHPIANVIGYPSRSVSTRKQLQTDAIPELYLQCACVPEVNSNLQTSSQKLCRKKDSTSWSKSWYEKADVINLETCVKKSQAEMEKHQSGTTSATMTICTALINSYSYPHHIPWCVNSEER